MVLFYFEWCFICFDVLLVRNNFQLSVHIRFHLSLFLMWLQFHIASGIQLLNCCNVNFASLRSCFHEDAESINKFQCVKLTSFTLHYTELHWCFTLHWVALVMTPHERHCALHWATLLFCIMLSNFVGWMSKKSPMLLLFINGWFFHCSFALYFCRVFMLTVLAIITC